MPTADTAAALNDNTTVTLLEGDCLAVMKMIPDASVQLVIADLPYGLTHLDWDKRVDLEAWWREVRRILIAPTGVVLCHATQPFSSDLVASNREWFRYALVWRKTRPAQFHHSAGRPLCDHEDVLVFSPGSFVKKAAERAMKYNAQGLTDCAPRTRRKNMTPFNGRRGIDETVQTQTNYPRSVLDFASVSRPVHPTQKPTPLVQYLVETYSDPGDMILDPTCGSGTTGEAAILTGRSFTGIELDPLWYDVACLRLSDDSADWETIAREWRDEERKSA